MTSNSITFPHIREKISSACYPFASRFALVMIYGLPWSHAFFYIGFVGFLFCVLASTTRYKELLNTIKRPTAFFAVLLFLYIGLGLLYSIAPIDMGIYDFKKYRKLLLIPLFIGIFKDTDSAKKLILAYSLGVLTLMTPTLLDGFGLMKLMGLDMSHFRDQSYNASSIVYWRNHIVHGFHVSIFFTICVISIFRYKKFSFIFFIIAILCVCDILFFINGRAALFNLLVSALLLIFYYINNIKNIKLIFTILAAILIVSASTYHFSNKVHERVISIMQESQAYDEKNNVLTSGGQRLYMWSMSFKLFLNAPIIGNGLGAFRQRMLQPDNLIPNIPYHHTHNEYLTLAAQNGLIGLALFFALIWFMYKNANQQNDGWLKGITKIGIAIFLISALTDSSLHNESEGWTFMLLACLANTPNINRPKS